MEIIIEDLFGKILKFGFIMVIVMEIGYYKVLGMYLICGIVLVFDGRVWVICGFDFCFYFFKWLGFWLCIIKFGNDIDVDYVIFDENDNVYIFCCKNWCIKFLNKDIRIWDMVVLNDFFRGIVLL